MNNINIGQLINQIAAIVRQIVSYGLLLLVAAVVLQQFGVRVPAVPAIDPTRLAYICGAWWLLGGK